MALTVTAGGAATAAQYNALIPYYLAKGSDQALSTTTFTADNTFTAITIGANQVWVFDMFLSFISANAGNDAKTRLAFTGTATGSRRHILTLALTAGNELDENVNLQCRQSTSSVSGGVSVTGDEPVSWQEHFVISGGASGGTWGLEWAQSTATSGSTTMNAGGSSYIIGHRVS